MRFIDKLQHQSIRISKGHGIISGRVVVLRRQRKNLCADGDELGIEMVHIGAAIDVKRHMV